MLDRREFIKLIVKGAILGNFYKLITPPLAQAVTAGDVKKLPVVMIETGTCTGDSISFDNIWTPTFSDILSNILDWRYDWSMNQAQGDAVYQVLQDTYTKMPYEYVLLVQGAMIRSDAGHYDHVAYEQGKLTTGIDLVRRFGLKAKYVVAIGSCAAYGGRFPVIPIQLGQREYKISFLSEESLMSRAALLTRIGLWVPYFT